MNYCPNCNRVAQSEDERFCAECGSVLVPQVEEVPVVEEVVAVEPQPVPVAEPAYVPSQPQYAPVEPQPVPVQQYQAAAVQYQPAPSYQPVAAPVEPAPQPKIQVPAQYKPLGAWAYFGYSLLFSIPIVGFIFLIVFSFSNSNINRRNYARSYWCGLLIVGVIAVVYLLIALILSLVFGASVASMETMMY